MFESLPGLLLLIPLLTAFLIRLIPRHLSRVAAAAGALVALVLYLLLVSVPLDFPAEVAIEWQLWRQNWELSAGTWTIMRLVYITAAVLFLLAVFWLQEGEFVAAGLASLSPLAASLMLPFAPAAVALILATLAMVIMVQAGNHESAAAPLRYFLLTGLAFPFLLLAGWMLISEQLVFADVVWRLLAVGLALLLAGFPFHIWVRPLVSEAPSLALLFLFGLVHVVFLVFTFDLLQDSSFLDNNDRFHTLLRWSGIATTLVGVILTWRPQSHRHLLGALLLLDLGSAIVAVSLGNEGLRPALLLVSGRFISLFLVLAALRLAQRQSVPDAALSASSLFHQIPWSTLLFAYGLFSLVGLPLTPGFAGRWALLALAADHSLLSAVVLLLALAGGTVGLLIYVCKLDRPSRVTEPIVERTLAPRNLIAPLLLAIAFVLALLPQPLLTFATYLATLLA